MIYGQYASMLLFAAIVVAIFLVIKFKEKEKISLAMKIVSLSLGLVFFFEFMLGHDEIQRVVALSGGLLNNKALNFFTLICNWTYFSAVLLIILYPFFKERRYTALVKYYATPVVLLNIGFMAVIDKGNLGISLSAFSLRGLLLGICLGIMLGYCISTFFLEGGFKIAKNDAWGFAYIPVMLLATMPSYMLNALFGPYRIFAIIDDFNQPHRWVLYMAIVVPILLYVLLKRLDKEQKRGIMIFITLATLMSFCLNYKFIDLKSINHWPFHLCHTAMYIIPLCLIFKWDKLFYFTYFINVFGAFIAMAIPDYAVSYNLFDPTIVKFYINHYCAFFMPIVIVGLRIFDRPKLKQFLYSCLGFLAYFVLILFLNAWFSNYGPSDYFYTNSDYIVDKLGLWAENTMKITWTFHIKDLTFTFYPLYQLLFFLVYILIALVMWFGYEAMYSFVDTVNDIIDRKRKIKMDTLALEISKQKNVEVDMDREVKLVLNNFSKRYGSSTRYAVKDACLEVEGGQVYGFLGHNGAGKSTIIKSIVGIQPITSGSITVCGYDVEKESIEAKKLIGFVPDQYALYEKLTGREYVNYIADLYEVPTDKRNKAIDYYVNLFDLADAFDNQIKTYSHGMKQKVTIISALVHEPKVWILDEPLTGLDPTSIYQVKQCMKQHAEKGNIVFFSSHLIDIVKQICDKVAIIKKGHILYSDTVENIENTEGLEQFYLRLTKTTIDDLEKADDTKKSKVKKENRFLKFFKRRNKEASEPAKAEESKPEDKPANEEPKAEPKAEQKTEEPKGEEPKQEQPKAEEPAKVEQKAADEPKGEGKPKQKSKK